MKTISHTEVLEYKLAKMFPDSAVRRQIRDELGKYGLEPYEKEIPRVQLAILKVAGSSLEKVKEWTAIAKQDYRDVLASAEYPEALVSPTWQLPPSKCNAIETRDSEQYRRWIEEE